jgi:septum site-determining protein MinD
VCLRWGGVGQSLIRDRRCPQLHLLAASQTRDKTALTDDGVSRVLNELRQQFDYIVCDSPAGIESGAHHAMFFADRAIVCTNPEVSSVRDSDKMLGILNSKSYRASKNMDPIEPLLLVTRYQPERVAADAMLSLDDITEMLGIPCIGVIPESPDILTSVNMGQPVIVLGAKSNAALAYDDVVRRFLGEDVPLRFLTPEKKGLLARLMGR